MIAGHRLAAVSRSVVVALAALGALVPPAFAQADAPDAFTYVAEWTIARDQWQGYAEWGTKNHKPILERLGADGTLLDWGFFETYIHTEGSATHGLWWTSATFAGVEKARVELLKAPFHPAAAAGAHRDYLFRTSQGGRRSGAVSGGFLYVNTQEIRAGQGGDWMELWKKNNQPILDELLGKGSLASYAIHYEDVHTAPISLRYLVTVSTGAAAEDQIEAAFAAASAKRGEAESEALGRLMRDLTVPESHRDYLARVTAAWFK